jgi:hypothetical protein
MSGYNSPVNRPRVALTTGATAQDDMWSKGRGFTPPRKQAGTHCKRGHELTPENSHWKVDGKRQCRICRNAWERAAYHRRKEAA